MGNCVRPFFGVFKDEHESPPGSDDEGEDDEANAFKPKEYPSKAKGGFKLKKPRQLSIAQYVSKKSVSTTLASGEKVTEEVDMFEAQDQVVPQGTLKKLSQVFPALHTVRIIHCALEAPPPKLGKIRGDGYGLAEIDLSHNKIETLKRTFIYPNPVAEGGDMDQIAEWGPKERRYLEKVIMDHNRLNSIQTNTFSGPLMKNLIVISLCHNKLTFLPADFLKKADKVMYLDISHNHIQVLPESVCECEHLQLLVCSHNFMVRLPDTIGKLTDLRKLFISYNLLTELPSSIGDCRKLEKIRVISNKIKALPKSTIALWNPSDAWRGYADDCPFWVNSRKEKARDSHGNEKKDEPKGFGQLKELLVEGNPLITPSITAFDMGGLDQAMGLFSMWITQQEAEENQMLAIADAGPIKEHSAEAKTLALTAQGEAMEVSGGIEIKRMSTGFDRSGSLASLKTAKSGDQSVPLAIQDEGGGEDGDNPTPGDGQPDEDRIVDTQLMLHNMPSLGHNKENGHYYYGHCFGDSAKVSEIRAAEARLLVLKKRHYIEDKQRQAFKQTEMARALGRDVPAHVQAYAQKDFDITKFTGKVHVTDLDLYFNLLVFSTKPMFSTCKGLFDKFKHKSTEAEKSGGRSKTKHSDAGSTGAPAPSMMDSFNWANLCTHVPVKLPDEVQAQMWDLMCSTPDLEGIGGESPRVGTATGKGAAGISLEPHQRITEDDFIAGWHIHDVETRDSWIARVAKTLQLNYYDMDVAELHERLKGKGAEDATPCLDFDEQEDDSRDEADAEDRADYMRKLPVFEGERSGISVRQVRLHDESVPRTKGLGGLGKMSLTETEYNQLVRDQKEESDSIDEEQHELESCNLSSSDAGTDSASDVSFDATERMGADEDIKQELERFKVEGAQNQRMEISGDADMEMLMSLPVHEIIPKKGGAVGGRSGEGPVEEQQSDERGFKRKRRVLINKDNLLDTHYKSDVYTVRKAIREAFRNLPFDDFNKLINFLLRGLKLIKHFGSMEDSKDRGWWHADDPSFRHTMGLRAENRYTQQLLFQMGFICVNDMYWIWPSKHLTKAEGVWGNRVAGAQLTDIGMNDHRLEDMITLMVKCQYALVQDHRKGKFRGHFS